MGKSVGDALDSGDAGQSDMQSSSSCSDVRGVFTPSVSWSQPWQCSTSESGAVIGSRERSETSPTVCGVGEASQARSRGEIPIDSLRASGSDALANTPQRSL